MSNKARALLVAAVAAIAIGGVAPVAWACDEDHSADQAESRDQGQRTTVWDHTNTIVDRVEERIVYRTLNDTVPDVIDNVFDAFREVIRPG